MSEEKVKAKDFTSFEGPVGTGNAHGKRPADKKNGDGGPDESVANKGKKGADLPGTTTIGEELTTLFSGVEGLSEDFTTRATVIIEGALSEKTALIREELEAEFETKLQEAITENDEVTIARLDEYLSLFVEEYIKENAVAIEKGFRQEIAENVIASMVAIVENAGVTLPEDKVDIAEALATENEELTAKYNDSLNENVKLRKDINRYQIAEAFTAKTEGLTEGQKDKLKKLTENMEFANVEQFNTKIDILKESIAEGPAKPADNTLTEASEAKPSQPVHDAKMQAYLAASRGSYFNK